ncbi:GlxA family transcriptional regulator [Nocardioides jensenii]|uniref:GlxA family transcriptional regulator n=1 Tax=Nocardioides jensenii TaxID=1843 RepID=UPI00083309D2|nr:helix-turn-helix domain-containing protein [Nocardioides jensenii]
MSVPHRIVVLALPPVIGYDLVIPTLVFGTANTDDAAPRYDVTVASLDGKPVSTSSGYDIAPHSSIGAIATADTVIIPGTQTRGPRHDGVLTPDLRAAFDLIRPGTRLMSICTGAFVLAAAGLLDGRRATTHWSHAESFRSLYPHVDLDENALFVDDGDVLTSAGLAAGMDLCLHVVRHDHGSDVANHVARYCVVPPWRDGGQAQFIEKPLPEAVDESTAGARDWALAHLDLPIAVSELAAQARMSVRTFARRFRAETGHSPGAWLTAQRIRYAQRLLETTDLPVDLVAARAGLGTGASLRQHLRTVAGVSPSAYRRTFRGALGAAG